MASRPASSHNPSPTRRAAKRAAPPARRAARPANAKRGLALLLQAAKEQGVKPIKSIEELRGSFRWPEDESIEDFCATIRRWRHEGTPQGRKR